MKRELLIGQFLAMPWAIQREKLAAITRMIAGWHLGGGGGVKGLEDDAPVQRVSAFEAARQQAQTRVGAGAIAVIPVYGVVVQRANMMTDICGGASTQQISSALRDALNDETVGAIIFDLDSPGGSVDGVSELFDEITAARAKKPVTGIANSLAASAAYWLGCACSELYVTPGGEVGSIGVWQAHEDWSAAMEDAGVKTTLISAGKYKTEGNPYQPLDADAQAFMQSRVDDYYAAFTRAVAKGRGVPIAQVRDGMGQGRVLGADAALTEKMVDGIGTFDQVVGKVRRDMKPMNRGASRVAQAQRETAIAAAEL